MNVYGFVRITKDPTLTQTQSGTPMLRLSLVDDYKDKNGEKKGSFYDAVFFGKRAESVKKFLRKGQEVMVVGEGFNKEYEDEKGYSKKKFDVTLRDIIIPHKEYPPKEEENRTQAQTQAQDEYEEYVPDVEGPETFDEPIPF